MIDPRHLLAILVFALLLIGAMGMPAKDSKPWESVTWGLVTIAILVALIYTAAVVDRNRPACPLLPPSAERAP